MKTFTPNMPLNICHLPIWIKLTKEIQNCKSKMFLIQIQKKKLFGLSGGIEVKFKTNNISLKMIFVMKIKLDNLSHFNFYFQLTINNLTLNVKSQCSSN